MHAASCCSTGLVPWPELGCRSFFRSLVHGKRFDRPLAHLIGQAAVLRAVIPMLVARQSISLARFEGSVGRLDHVHLSSNDRSFVRLVAADDSFASQGAGLCNTWGMRKMTRQEALKTLTLPALAAAMAGTMVTSAQAKASKATVKYQNSPKGSAKCSGCKFFIAGKSKTAMGTCQIVDGAISPNGWCTAYTKK